MGPLRGLRSSGRSGSLKRPSGSTLRLSSSGSEKRRPRAAPAIIVTAEAMSAVCAPCVSAVAPQIQLPAAMPPKVVVW